jgi:hypothetical protein
MKIESLLLALFAGSIFGCADRPVPPPPPPAAPAGGVEVEAPGVHVEAGGGKGVEVKAPGADVEVPPPQL